ncbi:MAG: tRNA (guanosine(46)-N7)-methyltransferase TrmB [Burkholderiales bacterium]|nr:tRNA (guanosine(46)-N7)-methyltransferase TrmB [Burkholderiales bacterium]
MMNHDENKTPHKPSCVRPVRSYVLRQGRLTPAQSRALLTLSPLFVVAYAEQPIDFKTLFGRDAKTVIEIGFGMGAATAKIAQENPDTNFLGIEVHTPGVGSLLREIETRSLSNVRIVQHDAVEVIKTMIAPASLDGVHIFFPDPWHKKRHHKRRLLQPLFLEALAARVKEGGYLHVATDWEDYAHEILALVEASAAWENVSPEGFTPRPPTRPQTKFEARGIKLGHRVFDIVAQRK